MSFSTNFTHRRVGKFCLILTLILISPVVGWADDYWDGLSDERLLLESQAAFHLGYLDPVCIPDGVGLPCALSLANRLLARADVSTTETLGALRIKFKVFDARGFGDEWEQAFGALPPQLPGVEAFQWQKWKLLRKTEHDAAIGDWQQVFGRLNTLSLDHLEGEAVADLALLQARATVRQTPGSTEGYFNLTHSIRDAIDWGISDPLFDPYYGQLDLSALNRWEVVGEILPLLEADTSPQRIGLRRWFEFASPSVLSPFGAIFPDITVEERNELSLLHRNRVESMLAELIEPFPAVGGFRELLGNQIRMEDIAYAGRAVAVDDALADLPDQVAGVPDEVLADYRLMWEALSAVASLQIGDVMLQLDAIETAADRLPPARFGRPCGQSSNRQSLPTESFPPETLRAVPQGADLESSRPLCRGRASALDGSSARTTIRSPAIGRSFALCLQVL